MPSPFPGMDPYLEDPALWPDVHHELISVCREQLNSSLGPGYYVRVEERVYVSDEDDPGRSVLIPDLRVGETEAGKEHATQPSGVKIAEPVLLTTLFDDEIREARLEVVDHELRDVITVIEILSPSNKVAGSRARDSYRRKRREVMLSPSHWVEIDLLRAGEPVIKPSRKARGDYFVHVSRVDRRPKGFVWAIHLEQQLPVITIPLKSGDEDGTLDLQQALHTAYDRAAYQRIVNYRVEPAVPLAKQQATWADQLLKEKGLR